MTGSSEHGAGADDEGRRGGRERAGDGGGTDRTGAAGGRPLHRERLWPSVPAWGLVVLAFVLVLVTLLPVSRGAAVVGGLLAAAAAVAALVRASAVVEVTREQGLRAGRARLPGQHVGAVRAARGEGARALRGVELDARTHLVLRGWVDPVVLVEVDDPDDPTPSWLVSTRHPERLAAALTTLASLRPTGGPERKPPGPPA